jgi:hypothetical protein
MQFQNKNKIHAKDTFTLFTIEKKNLLRKVRRRKSEV